MQIHPLSTLMPQAENNTRSRSHSVTDGAINENAPPLSLDTSKEALIKVSSDQPRDTQSCDRVS
jgi:hypothetical protein